MTSEKLTNPELVNIIEGLLFVASEPVSINHLASVVECPEKEVEEALTHLKTLEQILLDIPVKPYDSSRYSLVELSPKTGRMHQIRVHLSHLGYPIFADEKYLNREQWEKDTLVLRRHFLHAEKLGFRVKGEKIGVTAPLSEDLKKCVALLKK